VCTADLGDPSAVQAQVDGYRAAFEHLLTTRRTENGFVWVFEYRPDLVARLRTLAENEHRCCRFFEFDLRTTDDHILWEVRGDPRATSVVDEFARMPERLAREPRRGHDLAELKRRTASAGLVFSYGSETPASGQPDTSPTHSKERAIGPQTQ
jgi:hypothetical protein